MSDIPIRVRNKAIEDLASRIRDHPATGFTDEYSQDDVVKYLLSEKLERLEEEADISEEAQQAQRRLKADILGNDDQDELVDNTDLPEDEVTARQAKLREQMKQNSKRGRWG